MEKVIYDSLRLYMGNLIVEIIDDLLYNNRYG